MVELKEIKLANGIITAVCYIEGNPDRAFTLSVDTEAEEITECSLAFPGIYAGQAAAKLLKLHRAGTFPRECTAVWC